MAIRSRTAAFDPPDPQQMDTLAMADACNADQRFQEAGWKETPDSIEQLLLTARFRTWFTRLLPHGPQMLAITAVAAIYACRVNERGAPKKRRIEMR